MMENGAVKKEQKYSLAMIVRNCADELDKCLSNFGKYPDEIIVVNTGITEDEKGFKETSAVAEKHGAKVFHFPWIEDFSAARNFSFSKCSHDYVMWIDSDDVVDNPKRCDQNIRMAINGGADLIFMEYLYEFDQFGNCTTMQDRERVVRKACFNWPESAPVHECLCATRKVTPVYMPPQAGRIVHTRKLEDQEQKRAAMRRNLKILRHHFEGEGPGKRPAEMRMIYYWANTLHGLGDHQGAVEKYREYLRRSREEGNGHESEVMAAMTGLAESLLFLEKADEAMSAISEAIVLNPTMPTPYAVMAKIAIFIRDWQKAELYAQQAIDHAGQMKQQLVSSPREVIGRSQFFLTMCAISRGDIPLARQRAEEAKKFFHSDPQFRELESQINQKLSFDSLLSAWRRVREELLAEGRRDEVAKLAAHAPRAIAEEADVTAFTPKLRPKDKRSIAFLCLKNPGHGPWGPWSIKNGIGGSEEAVINLSREFAKRGWHVEVYTDLGKQCAQAPYEYDGVLWYPVQMWSGKYDNPLDVAISWRTATTMRQCGTASKLNYVWLHDIPVPHAWGTGDETFFDGFFVLSKYHAKLFGFLPEDKKILTENALDPELLVPLDDLTNEPHRMIWGSDPSRGLQHLLPWWAEIRKEVPDAELDVFYGWSDMYRSHMQQDLNLRKIFDQVEALKNQPGINWHGKVGQDVLAKAYARSGVWPYMTTFPEIHPVRGDTLVETLAGSRRIDSLVGEKDFKVYSCDASGELGVSTVGGVFLTRKNAPMVKLTMRPGKGRNARKETTLHCTPDHEIMLRDGSYKPAGELRVGDRVKAFHNQKNAWQKGYAEIGVTGRPVVPAHRFVAEKCIRPLQDGEIVHHRDGDTTNNCAENLEITVQSEHRRGHWNELSAEEKAAFGKNTSRQVRAWQDKIGPAATRAVRRRAVMTRWAKNHVVTKVEDGGSADAFCMTVEPDHNFVANGIFVHNCITALKAQAHGVQPITVDDFALSETVQFGEKLKGPMSDPLRQREFVERVVHALKNPWPREKRLEMARWARSKTWASVAAQWDEVFSRTTTAPPEQNRLRVLPNLTPSSTS